MFKSVGRVYGGLGSRLLVRGYGSGQGSANVVNVRSMEEFRSHVLDVSRSKPVMVDCYADWCGPCRSLGPVLKQQVEARDGAVTLALVDVDQVGDVAGHLGVSSIPFVCAFSKGEMVDQFVGAIPPPAVKAFIDSVVAKHKSA